MLAASIESPKTRNYRFEHFVSRLVANKLSFLRSQLNSVLYEGIRERSMEDDNDNDGG